MTSTRWRWLLAEPAYPTTYASPPLPYATGPVANGVTVYAHNCAQCHGEDGRGKGPAADSLAIKPVDLTEHASHHRAGDLYWWIAHGNLRHADAGLRQAVEQRRDLERCALPACAFRCGCGRAAADGADFSRWTAAPDFNLEVGAHAQESLTHQRDRHLVLTRPLHSAAISAENSRPRGGTAGLGRCRCARHCVADDAGRA